MNWGPAWEITWLLLQSFGIVWNGLMQMYGTIVFLMVMLNWAGGGVGPIELLRRLYYAEVREETKKLNPTWPVREGE